MPRERSDQFAARQIPPPNPLLVAGLLFDQSAISRAVGRAAVMQHPRRRLEDDNATGPVQAEREVDVLEIGPELPRKPADAEEQFAAIERTGAAGTEDFASAKLCLREWLAVAELAGETAAVIAVAGT